MDKKDLKHDDFYETPPWLYDLLDTSFGPFELDVCADEKTAKCSRFYSLDRGEDSLVLPWGKRNFCNPPYSRNNKDAFIRKAIEEQEKGNRTTMIIPARVGTKTYKDLIWANPFCYEYPLGRIKFWLDGKESSNSGRDDIMVVVFFPKL